MCPPIDRLGETGKNAAQSAANHACEYLAPELLKHVRENDYQALNIAISDGIREMLGVPGTGRRIRKALGMLAGQGYRGNGFIPSGSLICSP
jgi:hypothetical protein